MPWSVLLLIFSECSLQLLVYSWTHSAGHDGSIHFYDQVRVDAKQLQILSDN